MPPPRSAADDRPPRARPPRPRGVPSPRAGSPLPAAPPSAAGDRARPAPGDVTPSRRGKPPERGPGARRRPERADRADHSDRSDRSGRSDAVQPLRPVPPAESAPHVEPAPPSAPAPAVETAPPAETVQPVQSAPAAELWTDAVPPEPTDAARNPTGGSTPRGGPESSGGPGPTGGPAPHHAAGLDHGVLKSLLGAWALAACSAQETAAVEAHLTDCAPCAGEALRLRDAVALLHPEDNLDLDPRLRSRVLEGALGRRPARIPIPEWAEPFDAETARLDALLRDMADAEWRAPVRLRWFEGEREHTRTATVAEVISHLMAVDGLLAGQLGLSDPLAALADEPGAPQLAALANPASRTEAYWSSGIAPEGRLVHGPWREQTHALMRGASFADATAAEREVRGVRLPLRDAFLDRAFECWTHAVDIADAVDYPHPAPEGAHLRQLIGLAARTLPHVLADRRRAGLAAQPRRLSVAGAPGRTLHLEVEGSGGGDWYIALDSPTAEAGPEGAVAHVAMDGVEFCQLVAGHVSPLDAAAGAEGDPQAIRDVLFATASMSRL
ncbi:zf-HC2 domain-containing protein [Streptomyces sp. OF8]|uniref:Zf-HC2 domain-containing protein n=1 Tax=Streptomyces alkaliterrae TaxID=2213162 RepID=A0A7W3WXU6_9ACTN|nr:zf-HC2 domain-containing protein [Streptomyces alkaliterrae]